MESRTSLNAGWASDGIFPLAILRGDKYDPPSNDALLRILDYVGGRQEVTLWLNGTPSEDSGPVPGGQITLGGPDMVNCGAKWQKVNAKDDWSVYLNNVTVGSKTVYSLQSRSDTVSITVASPMLIVPSDVFDAVIRSFYAEYDFELDLYTVNCARISSLPAIKFNIGDDQTPNVLEYAVPADKFVTKV
ncbi:aspartic protease, partial [Aphelenchoides avenae]